MRAAKVLITIFLVVLFIYVNAFTWIEHVRVRQGPWELTFTTYSNNTPCIIIKQHALNITNTIVFPGATTTNTVPETIPFAGVHQVPFDVPFGQCIFLDTLTLPGNVTLKVFGHEIQLLPRVLTIDAKEQAWKSEEVIALPAKP